MDARIEISDQVASYIDKHNMEHWIDRIKDAMVKTGKQFSTIKFVGARVAYTGTNVNCKSVSGSTQVGEIFKRKSYFGESDTFIYLRVGYTAKCIPIEPTSDEKFEFVWRRGDNWSSNSEQLYFELS